MSSEIIAVVQPALSVRFTHEAKEEENRNWVQWTQGSAEVYMTEPESSTDDLSALNKQWL